MKIKLENLGVIKQAEFELGDLTIICGDNNTGKTYATYALFGFLNKSYDLLTVDIESDIVDVLLDEGTVHINLTNHLTKVKVAINTLNGYLIFCRSWYSLQGK